MQEESNIYHFYRDFYRPNKEQTVQESRMYGKKNLVVRLATLTKVKETLQKRKDIKKPDCFTHSRGIIFSLMQFRTTR